MLGFDEVEAIHDAEWAELVERSREWPILDVYDGWWQPVSRIVGEIGGEAELILNDAGQAKIPLFVSNPIVGWLDQVPAEQDVHLVIEQSGVRWSGKVRRDVELFAEDGLETVTLEATHDFGHAKALYCYPNPFFPAAVQWPKIFAWAGPAKTGILLLLFLNLLRNFAPLWRLPHDPFSAAAWKASLDPAQWPQIVDPRGLNLIQDTSRWTIFATRMGNFFDVVKPILDDSGLQLVADRWLPGDPQPFPEWVVLDRPVLIWRIVDKSGVRGPTGTLIDGAIRWIATTADDMVSEIVSETPWQDPAEYLVQGWTGTVPEAPAVVWTRAQRTAVEHGTGVSGIVSWSRAKHRSLARAVIVGGKSPGWVNMGFKLIANAILGYLGMLIGNPGLALGIFEDQVENVVFAWSRIEHKPRALAAGSDPLLETFESADSGFGIKTIPAARTGFYKTRPYTSFEIATINAVPYIFGTHYEVGDRVSAEDRNRQLYTDQVMSAKLTWSRSEDPTWRTAIGPDDTSQPPTARLARELEQVRAIVQAISANG